MPYRGYFNLDGAELSNTSRLLAHMSPNTPTVDGETAPMMSCACDIHTVYDDSWTGLQAAVGDGPYVITEAPWYNPARPQSAEFAGIWVLDVQGMDSVPVSRDVADSICAGGIPSPARDTARTVHFSALVVGCTNAGARYGLDWLSCTLRRANVRAGVDISFYGAHPEDTAADPETLKRNAFGVVLTQAPTVQDVAGKGGGNQHRQASIFRVEWEMVFTNPYLYSGPNIQAVNWDATTEEDLTWVHAPDCADADCALPVIYNAECAPPDVTIVSATIPTCGGCIPICTMERRTWEMPTQFGSCDDTVVSVRVTNEGDTDPLTVSFYWRPCGSTDPCDQVSPLQVSGLQPGHIAVADSVTGRPYVEVDGVAHRQVGVVSTPSGAPWRSTHLESLTCWELVAESAPGADYSVIVELRDRDA